MPKEFFHYPETAKLFGLLEEASHRSGVSRGQAFEDFLTMSVAALSGGRMEEQYLQTVSKHTSGQKGQRGCDSLASMFAELVAGMEQDTREDMKDILGDLFEGAISYGEHQQYMTPMPVCRFMARMMSVDPLEAVAEEPLMERPAAGEVAGDHTAVSDKESEERIKKRVLDPCCGGGRMLLAAAEINRDWEFVGQDIDLRCVRITALNLAFRNLYGYVIWGNTLALEQKLVYRTGFDGRGFLREIPLAACPAPVQQQVATASPEALADAGVPGSDDELTVPKHQLRLF